MNRRRFLVTGGAGFIGSHIAVTLANAGHQVRVLDDFSTGYERNLADVTDEARGRFTVLRGDLRDAQTVRDAVEGVDVIFHEGAVASVPRSLAEPEVTLDVNVHGTLNVLEAARVHGVRRVVIASSSAIYGDTPTLPLSESMAPRPLSPYAVHKLTGEHFCSIYGSLYGLETVALRYFNVYGPRQDPNSEYAAVIPRFVERLRAGEPPIVFGDGEQTRDFVYVGDVVRANLLAATVERAAGGVFNVASGQRTSLNQVLRIASELLGGEARPEYREARIGDVRDSVADITLARDVLGFAPQVEFADGLASLLAGRATAATLEGIAL
ncbi:MAG TPA: SDR family oxidoreductase [Ktedonobacterales bacterium]